LLIQVLPEAQVDKQSFRSFRSGFAYALLTAGCPPAAIQALARWSSEEPLKVCARLNPSDYAAWINKVSTQQTDSTITRHMPPLTDEYVTMEFFLNAGDILKRADARFSASLRAAAATNFFSVSKALWGYGQFRPPSAIKTRSSHRDSARQPTSYLNSFAAFIIKNLTRGHRFGFRRGGEGKEGGLKITWEVNFREPRRS
jgi:hypothetical protein